MVLVRAGKKSNTELQSFSFVIPDHPQHVSSGDSRQWTDGR